MTAATALANQCTTTTTAGITGAQTFFIVTSLTLICFFAARSYDTYRHRLAKDRAMADAYRVSMRAHVRVLAEDEVTR